MMFVSFNSNTTGNTSRAGTVYISRTRVFIQDFVVFVLLSLSFSVSCVLERLLVEQELLTLPEHLSSPLVFVGFVLLNLKFSVSCFVDNCFVFLSFFF